MFSPAFQPFGFATQQFGAYPAQTLPAQGTPFAGVSLNGFGSAYPTCSAFTGGAVALPTSNFAATTFSAPTTGFFGAGVPAGTAFSGVSFPAAGFSAGVCPFASNGFAGAAFPTTAFPTTAFPTTAFPTTGLAGAGVPAATAAFPFAAAPVFQSRLNAHAPIFIPTFREFESPTTANPMSPTDSERKFFDDAEVNADFEAADADANGTEAAKPDAPAAELD